MLFELHALDEFLDFWTKIHAKTSKTRSKINTSRIVFNCILGDLVCILENISDIFSDKKVELKNATPAQILQKILEEKWMLCIEDKDMVVMQHQFKYTLDPMCQAYDGLENNVHFPLLCKSFHNKPC